MTFKRLFHRRVIGFANQSVDCWYLVINDDQISHVHHTWILDNDAEPYSQSALMSLEQFVATTPNVEVLGSLNAAISMAVREREGRENEIVEKSLVEQHETQPDPDAAGEICAPAA